MLWRVNKIRKSWGKLLIFFFDNRASGHFLVIPNLMTDFGDNIRVIQCIFWSQ